MSQPYVEVTEGTVTRRIPVRGDRLVIGRNLDCGVPLEDTLASRQHCAIERGGLKGGWLVRDLKSRNGTKLNGRRVESEPLRSGDVLLVGSAQLRFIDPMHEEVGGTYSSASQSEDEVLSEDDLVVEDKAESGEEADFEVIDDEFAAEAETPSPPASPASPASPAAPPSRAGGTVASIPSQGSDPEKALEAIAQSLPPAGVEEGDIILLNSRGAVTHAAKTGQRSAGGGKREPVDFFRLLLVVCIRSRTTDIHLEPRQDCYGVRLRVDGVMVDVARLDHTFGVRVATLVKVLSDIDIAQRNALQEGHFTAKLPSVRAGAGGGGRRIDYRVSFAPSVFGQKLVIRILDAENAPLTLADMKLPRWMQGRLEEFVEQDAGMVVVAGPTGSGKTTTLYSLLRSIDLSRRNAVTIEDPVEMQLEGTTQMPVDEAGGKSFGAILRSVLRQDPDVIMVGEIRDAETARTAMQAAITGHMVLSSIHTRDTLGTVYRLLDLGVEPYLVSQALNIVVAQRLVRQLCPVCRKKTRASDVQRKALESGGYSGDWVFLPVGCGRCLGTGHSGRRGVFELLQVTDELRSRIQDNAPLEQLRECLNGTEFVSLLTMGLGLVADGNVSFEEVDRIGKR